MRFALVLVLLAGTSCVSAPARRPAAVGSLTAADRARLDGCYDCLLDARDGYRAAAIGPNEIRARLREFETELLIALREREFAVDNAPALARAAALASSLPAGLEAARYIELVAAVPHRGAGWARRDAASFRAAHADILRDVAGHAAWVRGGGLMPAVREYIARSIECAAPMPASRPADVAPRVPSDDPTPLARYREATCGAVDAATLGELRSLVPRFVETSYFFGELALNAIAQANALNPHQLVIEAERRFPQSPLVLFLAARLKQIVGDCTGALAAFDRLLVLAPSHEDGWLGRVMCLTDLLRHADAVAAATTMIDASVDNADEAQYWRAWNLHVVGDLLRARADIDFVRQRRQNAGILSLAGAIEHDQEQLDAAERDLRGAQRMGSGKVCRAFWYLGSVLLKTQRLAEAAATFDSAMSCYDQDAATRERLIATTLADPAVDAEFRRLQTARLRDEVRLQRHQQYASAFNVASIQLERRDQAQAVRYLEIAAQDPQLRAEVARLRLEIDRRSLEAPPLTGTAPQSVPVR
ncbi:MAG: hypothetical protein IT184_13815 [Acidobacteria bacterium]|nr:hypothetical protein [Acidobacteriota bacterium]